MIEDRWISGYGPFIIRQGVRDDYYNKLGYSKLSEKYNAHNNDLEALADLGVIGVTILVIIMTYLTIRIRKAFFKKSKHLRVFLAPFLAFAVVNFIHALTQNVFYDSSVTYIYLYLLLLLVWSLTFENTKQMIISSSKPRDHQKKEVHGH